MWNWKKKYTHEKRFFACFWVLRIYKTDDQNKFRNYRAVLFAFNVAKKNWNILQNFNMGVKNTEYGVDVILKLLRWWGKIPAKKVFLLYTIKTCKNIWSLILSVYTFYIFWFYISIQFEFLMLAIIISRKKSINAPKAVRCLQTGKALLIMKALSSQHGTYSYICTRQYTCMYPGNAALSNAYASIQLFSTTTVFVTVCFLNPSCLWWVHMGISLKET
jgi:hypothetical protein